MKCITCAQDAFDSTWETVVGEYLSMGGQEVIDEKTAAYNK